MKKSAPLKILKPALKYGYRAAPIINFVVLVFLSFFLSIESAVSETCQNSKEGTLDANSIECRERSLPIIPNKRVTESPKTSVDNVVAVTNAAAENPPPHSSTMTSACLTTRVPSGSLSPDFPIGGLSAAEKSKSTSLGDGVLVALQRRHDVDYCPLGEAFQFSFWISRKTEGDPLPNGTVRSPFVRAHSFDWCAFDFRLEADSAEPEARSLCYDVRDVTAEDAGCVLGEKAFHVVFTKGDSERRNQSAFGDIFICPGDRLYLKDSLERGVEPTKIMINGNKSK